MNKWESKYFNTAKLMDEALFCLLLKKDFQFITVKEICKKAGVNRSTFYLHYESMADLLQESIELLNTNFINAFKSHNLKAFDDAKADDFMFIKPEFLLPYLNFIKENNRVFSVVHKYPKLFNTQSVFNKMYDEIFEPTLKMFNVPKEKQPYVFEFYAKGVLAIVFKWISLDCQDSVDFVMSTIIECVNYERENGK